ncbi:MAG: heavy metal translocating P-type ATPase, partial [Tuberibacillus sp.]
MELQRTEHLKTLNLDNNNNKIVNILNEHGELIAALTSGLLMLAGWLLSYESTAASIALYLIAFVIGGYAKAKEGITETVKNKTLNVELLMFLAAIGSALIGYWWEGGALIFIFALSGALETYSTNKSSKEISSLLDVQPETARVIENGQERMIRVELLSIGDKILVKPGERIPADGVIIKGETTIDESAITGEPIPVSRKMQQEVYAGTMNINGSITIEVTKKVTETLFQKIIHLVQSAQSEKSPSQLFIEKFEDTYVKIVLLAVIVMMFLPHFVMGWTWNETLYRAMVLLVVASPCALVASIMPATLSAISNGARRGILFKGGVHLEQLSGVKAIAFDKTGTLTVGKPAVTDIKVFHSYHENELLRLAASIEAHSNHPLGTAIVHAYKSKSEAPLLEVDHIDETPGLGITAFIDGDTWRVGQADLFPGMGISEEEARSFKEDGKTVVYVGNTEGLQGIIALKDTIREESIKAVKRLKSLGIHTIMLTGDNETTARAIAAEAGVDDY